ncbi:glycosyltransferase family 1 protein [Salinicoccus roseus]|uniref:glycosyltransferase family 1 protein n=1 Tax=Salinicoccus roseus TaxID=45670 RepID=UPI0023016FB7|nr:glycosyltransferase family 1 protein [Salinicoccus roseus]
MSDMQYKEEVPRILHITGTMNRGGAETMLMNLYREIDKTKVQFDFLSYSEKKGDYDQEIKDMGGKVIYTPSPKKTGFIQYLKNFKNINDRYGPYYGIHAHTLFNSGIPLTCAWLLGIDSRICHAHSTSNSNKKGYSYKIYTILMKMMIKVSATKKIACSYEAGAYLFGQNFKKFGNILPNAIRMEEFSSVNASEVRSLKNEIGCENEELLIGNVGSFRIAKNHNFILKIAEEMQKRSIEFKMVLVGDGDQYEKIKHKVREKNLEDKIIFTGVRKDIPLFMNAFDVLLMPSLYEGFPVTLVESQGSKLPAVISDSITKEVDLGVGLINRISLSENTDAWVNMILKVANKEEVSNDVIYKRLHESGYTTTKSIEKLMKIYSINRK